MFDNGVVRKVVLLVVLAAAWEAYARWLSNPLLFPTFTDTVAALFSSVASGQLLRADQGDRAALGKIADQRPGVFAAHRGFGSQH